MVQGVIFLFISIQRGLENIKKSLEEKGYRVSYVDECNHPVDAYIYVSEHSHSHTNYNDEGIMVNSTMICHGDSNQIYTPKRINAYHKSINDIEMLLSGKAWNGYF